MHIITAITGASGALYSKKFIQEVNRSGNQQTILISEPGWEVMAYELEIYGNTRDNARELLLSALDLGPDLIQYEEINNYSASIASGSSTAEAMVIIPCTMGTAARLAQGISSNLLERAFDVMLKEKKKLIIVPRESPLNQIHLQNLLTLSQLGVEIIPAMPAFYHRPTKISHLIDFIVGRVLEHLSIEHNLYQRWSGN